MPSGDQLTSSELIMYSYYFPSVVTTAAKCANCHRHDFQTVIVWTVNNTRVRSICLSEPTAEEPDQQRCYKGSSFDMHTVDGPMKAWVEEIPMARRMHIDDDPALGYALYPVGPEGAPGSVRPLQHSWSTNALESADTPPCVDYALMNEAMLATINSQPFLQLGANVTIPFADDVFPGYIMRAIDATLNMAENAARRRKDLP